MSPHGGKRPGAGRPRTRVAGAWSVRVVLTPAQVQQLDIQREIIGCSREDYLRRLMVWSFCPESGPVDPNTDWMVAGLDAVKRLREAVGVDKEGDNGNPQLG